MSEPTRKRTSRARSKFDTLKKLTSHMPAGAGSQDRYPELHRTWKPAGMVDLGEKWCEDKDKIVTCDGCDTSIRYMFLLDSKIGSGRRVVGSTCITIFEEDAPEFVEACQPMLDEHAARQRLLNRKVPAWIRELPGIPLTNYRSVRRAIDNKTKRYMCEGYSHDLTPFITYTTKNMPDEDRLLFGA